MSTSTANIGHNNPPSDAEILSARLAEEFTFQGDRVKALAAAVTRAPAEINDADTADKVAQLAAQIKAACTKIEESRVAVKAPYLAAERTVDGFFKKLTAPLDGATSKLMARINAYQKRLADAAMADARRKAEEDARATAAKAAEEAAEKGEAAPPPSTKKEIEATAANIAKDAAKLRTDTGTLISMRTTHEVQITRPELVPEKYWTRNFDSKAILADLKAGRKIPGAALIENNTSTLR